MRGSVIRALGIWALLVPGAVALQPAFGDWQGFVPGLAGIAAGVAVGWAAARFRLSAALTVLMATVVYLLFGGAAALPRTTIAGVIPTVETLRRLVLLAVYSWRDLLTIATPAGDFTGPAGGPGVPGSGVGDPPCLPWQRSRFFLRGRPRRRRDGSPRRPPVHHQG